MNTFDEASKATEALFDGQQTIEPEVAEEPPQEQPEQQAEQPTEQIEQPPQGQQEGEVYNALENAVSTAEQATQAAVQQNQQLSQFEIENRMLREQNEKLNKAIEQMSSTQEQAILEQSMEMPVLNLNPFDDDEVNQQKMAEYSQKMLEYAKMGVMNEIQPFVEQAKEGLMQKEKQQTIETLATVPELGGIKEMVPELDHVISKNPGLFRDDIPMDEKYILAYAIAKGVETINNPAQPPKEPTAEELLAYYEKNPEFQNMVEKKRLGGIKQHQQVPPMSASSGAVNAALNIADKPKSFEEASERTRQLFGKI